MDVSLDKPITQWRVRIEGLWFDESQKVFPGEDN